jgi:serine/threonine-protein kinase
MSLGLADHLRGKYRVLAQLGQGGTADVLLAVARGPSGFNKLVVLKSMKSSLQAEPEIAVMFLSEARLAARLNHPNVVQTNEVFESPAGPVIVMEYLEGQPLSHIVARAKSSDKFPLAMRLRVICEALAGLHHAHELADFDGRSLNVVHRDMSPHNVFVTFDGQVKVLDFGIAKLDGTQAETATGVIKGKVRYMAPEQVTGDDVDRRADIYAIGIMLWEAATGERMWRNMSDATIMDRILNDEVAGPREVNANVSEELEAIIKKALATEKEDRYATAAELLQALEHYLGTLPDGNVRTRDIGTVVSDMFQDVRAQVKRVIEGQLAKVASLSNAEYEAAGMMELTHLGTTQSGLSASSRGTETGKSARPIVLGVAAAVLVLVGAGVYSRLHAPEVSVNAATTEKPAPVVNNKVRLRVTAFPATAKVYVDDELMPSNPFSRELERGGDKKVVITVKAPGFLDESRTVSLDQDADIVMTLTSAPVAPSATASAKKPSSYRPAVRPAATKPATQSKPSVSCDTPYTIDSRGVKHFKPECL